MTRGRRIAAARRHSIIYFYNDRNDVIFRKLLQRLKTSDREVRPGDIRVFCVEDWNDFTGVIKDEAQSGGPRKRAGIAPRSPIIINKLIIIKCVTHYMAIVANVGILFFIFQKKRKKIF
jgi:hypothetical protein